MSSPDFDRQALAREAELDAVRLATEHTLRTDPRYQAYFAGYTPASVEAFIQHYARHKVQCLDRGPNMVKFRLHQVIEYQEEGYDRLFDVQRKKLFDLQVRWRAGEITLPGIQTYQQFAQWQRAAFIYRCPFLPPITRAEYELYLAWLASDACQEFGHSQSNHRAASDWQDYDSMHAEWARQQPNAPAPTEDDNWTEYQDYPAWFAYYDAHTGAPAGYPFQTHSNRRGERQDYYMELASEEQHATNLSTPPTAPDPRPRLMEFGTAPDSFDDAPDRFLTEDDWHFAEFTRRFDADPETLLTYHRAMLCVFNESYNRVLDLTNQNIQLLGDARGPWPVPAHPDWRQGILAAAAHLHRELLLAALPTVFDDYEFRIQTGLLPAAPDQYRAYHDDQKPEEDPAKRCAIMPYLEEDILRGRELAGEPRDFNY
ncbi:hypothetical protein [Hymenobacter terrenus]|uniref:hypothetical protein n=1 Tax=Hymenobacter terrenus TaxID=1629124 RepID=UPI000619BE59|nr:hypothetical protein [Hymenobacter terrenus]